MANIHREDMVYIIYSIVKRKIKVQLWRHSAQYSAAAPSYCFALVFSSTTMMAFVKTSSGFIPLASCLTEDVEVSKIKRDSEKMFQYLCTSDICTSCEYRCI